MIENILNVLDMVYDPKIYNVEGIILKRSMMVMDWPHANSMLLQVRI
jgi:hypothetical protein